MIATNWFQKKWGFEDPVLIDELYSRIVDLEQRVRVLEEENVSTTNELYRMENSLDSRIDIIAEHCGINYDV
jgi:chaperonin cofactor prefoldin